MSKRGRKPEIKIWTEEEINFIKENCVSMSFVKISRLLKVRYLALCDKIAELSRYNEDSINLKLLKRLGSPDWSDLTEEEMIRGYIPPTYDELSDDEKEIFNNLKP